MTPLQIHCHFLSYLCSSLVFFCFKYVSPIFFKPPDYNISEAQRIFLEFFNFERAETLAL